jgi:ABC-type multidrug transport system ATPase subunit
MKIISGEEDKTSGKVSVFGYEHYEFEEKCHELVRMCAEESCIYENLSVKENIETSLA